MKFAVLFFGLVCGIQAVADSAVIDRYITQPVDHEKKNGPSFQQHVQILTPPGVKKTAPVVFMLGGEFGNSTEGLKALAAAYGAENDLNFIQADHRGYGSYSKDTDQSVPRYVTVKQAVADFHTAIQALRKEFTGPWIVLGYSYAGAVAVELASDFPDDVDVLITSSAPLDWPFYYTGQDQRLRHALGPKLYANLAARIQSLQPATVGDANWLERGFLQLFGVGVAQYQKAQPGIQLLQKTADISTPDLLAMLHKIDHENVGDMKVNFAHAEGARQVSLDDAKTGKFHGHFYIYQRCMEIGTFFGASATPSVFTQSEEEFRRTCQELFGAQAGQQKTWSVRAAMENLKVPLISVVGEQDPWAAVGRKVGEPAPRGELIVVPGGLHCPDRDDPAYAAKVIAAAIKHLPATPACDEKKLMKRKSRRN
ncbi:MAG: alpha/beta fold hydrolase [Bdellovibrionales bacterium]